MQKLLLARVLARWFLAGDPDPGEIAIRGSQALGRPWPWLRPLAERYAVFAALGPCRVRYREVVEFILQDAGFERASAKYPRQLSVKQWLPEQQQEMQPVPAASAWDLPAIETVGALADWLWLEHGDLQWFADLKGLASESSRSRLGHYHYRLLAKESGSVRLIEAPKPRLKKLQREILTGILRNIPSHPAVHGFTEKRSIITFAAPHVSRPVVLRMDLRDFFVSFSGPRIQTFFRTIGYPEAVADLLGGICANESPCGIFKDAPPEIGPVEIAALRNLYCRPHLPQGAPTSPALANFCFYRVDCRLAGLARGAGAAYTRYADDLAFSGDEAFARRAEEFGTQAAAILLDSGFFVNFRKTRIMRRGVRQHLAGLVVNDKANVRRSDFDNLKALLTNCVRFGPESQNRESDPAFYSHLAGRVGFVEMVNPGKAKRLRKIFEQITWR